MGVLKVKEGANWVPINAGSPQFWNSAWGVVKRIPRLATTTVSIGAASTLQFTGSTNFTFVNGRNYRVVCFVRAVSVANVTSGDLALYDGATALNASYGGALHFIVGPAYGSIFGEWHIAGTGQTHSALNFKGQCVLASTWYTNENSQFYIEDLGPTSPVPAIAPPAADWAPFDARYVRWGQPVVGLGAVQYNVETANVASAKTLDLSLYSVFNYTMTASTTFTFANPAPSGMLTEFMVIVRGAFNPSFPAAADWPDGAGVSYASPTAYAFSTLNGGTQYLGRAIGKAFA